MSHDERVYKEALRLSAQTELPGVGLSSVDKNITIPSGFRTVIQHVQLVIQTRGYENWRGGEVNLLITRGLVGRLSNTPNVGFAYEVQGVTEFFTSRGVRAIPGEQVSTEELRGRNWIIQPLVRQVTPQQPTTAVTRNLPGGSFRISFGNYVAAQRPTRVHYEDLEYLFRNKIFNILFEYLSSSRAIYSDEEVLI